MAVTYVAQTHNLWGDSWAAERSGALEALYRLRPPDLVATQELRPWSRDVLDASLPTHARVNDDDPGWSRQSNLWWNTELFELVESGADDVGILDPHAFLFWVRVRTAATGRDLVFATAHLTWPGHELELATGVNQRTLQASRITRRLADLAAPGSDVIFTVDINDIGPPVWEFGNAGYLDAHTALGRHSPPTHPVIPSGLAEGVATSRSPIASPPKAIDWIFFRGALRARACEVVDYFHRGVAASDHHPVVATFTAS